MTTQAELWTTRSTVSCLVAIGFWSGVGALIGGKKHRAAGAFVAGGLSAMAALVSYNLTEDLEAAAASVPPIQPGGLQPPSGPLT